MIIKAYISNYAFIFSIVINAKYPSYQTLPNTTAAIAAKVFANHAHRTTSPYPTEAGTQTWGSATTATKTHPPAYRTRRTTPKSKYANTRKSSLILYRRSRQYWTSPKGWLRTARGPRTGRRTPNVTIAVVAIIRSERWSLCIIAGIAVRGFAMIAQRIVSRSRWGAGIRPWGYVISARCDRSVFCCRRNGKCP